MEGLATNLVVGALGIPGIHQLKLHERKASVSALRIPRSFCIGRRLIISSRFAYRVKASLSHNNAPAQSPESPIQRLQCELGRISNWVSKLQQEGSCNRSEVKQEIGRVSLLLMAAALFMLNASGRFCRPALAAAESKTRIRSKSSARKKLNDGWGDPNAKLEEKEKIVIEYLKTHPKDVQALKVVLYARMSKGDTDKAIKIVERLMFLEPYQVEWRLVKAQLHDFAGQLEEAKRGFREILDIQHFSIRALQVAVVAPNVPAMYEMHFGVPMAGAVLSTLNIRHDPDTMSLILRHSEAKVVFVDYQLLEVIKAAVRILSQVTKELPLVIVIHELDKSRESWNDDQIDDHKDLLDYESLLMSGDPNFESRWPEDEWEAISLNYTSGTTSSPKGVVYSHRGAYINTVSNILAWEMKSRPVYLWTIPMFHCNGWGFPWGMAAQGGTSICCRAINAKDIFDAIAEHKVTHFCAAPTVLSIIANAPPHERRPLPHTVQVLTGGSPPPPPLLSRVEELGFHITHIYGLTESYGIMSSCVWKAEWDMLPSEERAKLKSRQGVGHLGVSKLDVKNPTTMESVPRDGATVGEIMIKGNTIMKGYLKASQATAEAFESGWFHTGDLGVIYPDGYLEIKDRSKDIIISGGENISSIEVETVIYSHPNVLEAAVVARPDDYWGETPCAFVKLKDVEEEEVTPESVINFCRLRLPRYMAPRTVIFADIPKTPTGKIQKYLLRERAKALGTIFPRNYQKE